MVVVGGGPVGSTLGLLLPDSLVLEMAEFPRDKVCGEGLMPAGLAILRAAGADLPEESFPVLEGVRYRLADGRSARAGFAQGTGRGVRRTRLDSFLAGLCGVRSGVRVTGVRALPDRVELETSAGRLTTRVVVAADGLRSSVARGLGWRRPPRGPGRYAIVGHLGASTRGHDIEVSLLGGLETYLAPVGEGEVLLAVLGPKGRLRADRQSVEETYRSIVERAHPELAGQPLLGRLRGAGPFNLRAATPARGRVFLVGDAAGFLDPLTGDGITAGLQQAQVLAQLLRSDMARAAQRYRQFWTRQWRRRVAVAWLARRLSGSPGLSQRAVAGMAVRPEALQRLLSVNQGTAGIGSLGWRDWAALTGVMVS